MFRLLIILSVVFLVACGAPTQPDEASIQARAELLVRATLAAQQPQPTQEPTPGMAPVGDEAPGMLEGVQRATAFAQQQPTMPPPPEVDPLVLEGEPTVLTSSYSTGEINYDTEVVFYDTEVVFRITNPNTEYAADNVQYQVTVKAGENVIYTSSGTDPIAIGPGKTRFVVASLEEDPTTRPEAADVTLYEDPSVFVPADQFSNLDQWQVANVTFQCPGTWVQCEATGDLTWTGDEPQGYPSVHVIAMQGNTIYGAGIGQVNSPTIMPGQTVPFTAILTGFPQTEEGGAPYMPPGELTSEVVVTSMPTQTP